MDEFTASAFEVSCNLLRPNATGWESEVGEFKPDLLLVESAWNGNDGEWHKKIDRVSPELVALINWCKAEHVPTIFWNKEDPVHYNGFVSTASLFDFVFTTDLGSVPRYKQALGHNRVYVMPFFCEPALHNPLNADRKPGFSFAGAYYKRYEERSKNFDALISGVRAHGPVTIFDRNFGENKPEFRFPDEYEDFIAGGLKYSEIDKSYKGFEFGINLNSVKQSQSMFARRVFDLVLSNTHVVSNYSLGLRLLFGDLVVSSDDAGQIESQVRSLLGEGDSASTNSFAAYVRFLALRKVLAEHTTQDRLAYIASRIWVDPPTREAPKVGVVVGVKESTEIDLAIAQFHNQTWTNKELIVLIDPDNNSIELPPQAEGIRYLLKPEGNLELPALTDAPLVSVWNTAASYGPNFLQDAVRAFEFGDVDCVSRVPVEGDPLGLLNAYAGVDSSPAMSSVWRTEAMPVVRYAQGTQAPFDVRISGLRIITLPSFDYASPCQRLADTSTWDLEINMGLPLSNLLNEAETLQPDRPLPDIVSGWNAEALAVNFPASHGKGEVQITHSADGLAVSSTLPADKHRYVYARASIPFAEVLGDENEARLHVVSRPGAAISLVVLFLDLAGDRLGSQVLPVNSNVVLSAPENTSHVHLGLRIQGSGSCNVSGISFGAIERAGTSVGILNAKSQLLVTNVYPSYGDLYRNGFVHSRVRSYRDAGLQTTVFVLNKRLRPGTYEFEGVDVQVGNAEDLDAAVRTNRFDSVLVHFLDETIWTVLEPFVESIPVIVWIHGAEIQPWYRRDFNYATEAERDKAKQLSAVRMSFWRRVFSSIHPNLHFVLVSRYFAEEVMSDVGIKLPANRYSVIHNFVDTEIFKYNKKLPEDRFRILSIRPFASRKYANDLTVEAILHLRKHPNFAQASILIVGDGVLFDEVLGPLNELENVEIRREFLAQSDIAELHQGYGVFMSPTRMDSQGVSRDEAMSSGLVPVTTAVTAIPEFVDPSCGILAPAEDAASMANGIASLWDDPSKFLEMSAAASRRVYQQSRQEKTIDAEVQLIRQRSNTPGVSVYRVQETKAGIQ
ncbi:glycosyltransferase [Arthrobacter zhaoxinii]|uniref:glycosyltransferase n=1 Tax=Arthrobacter zhaoxinii TaxID=2964616 RepID=UPI0021076719|nr:glycosyltransferase [Arthrobacter zhaoxinii]MCQ2000379.1 glycosyltransferase [Arthrobacter zhaoxinii]